jgi:hypothetical protein
MNIPNETLEQTFPAEEVHQKIPEQQLEINFAMKLMIRFGWH